MSTAAHLQRAELLADLGRYEDAAEELTGALTEEPENVPALTLLARVLLAAEKPKQAVEPADRAIAAEPTNLSAIAVRGLVLAELNRTSEAAAMAEQLLRLGPDEAAAQIMAAVILVDVRNGQVALDAAWRGVQLAPEDPEAHAVLGLVAFRLGLLDLAERAYREALRLDPELAGAQHDLGLIRFEQRRYAEGMSHLIGAAAANPSDMETGRSVQWGLGEALWTGTGYAVLAPILTAVLANANADPGGFGWRIRALVIALAGLIGLALSARRMAPQVRTVLPSLVRTDPRLGLAIAGVVAAPLLLLVYAAVGSPWPLALAVAGGFVAVAAIVLSRRY